MNAKITLTHVPVYMLGDWTGGNLDLCLRGESSFRGTEQAIQAEIRTTRYLPSGAATRRLRLFYNKQMRNIDEIVETYQHRKEAERYSRRVPMQEIEQNEYNLNISRYIGTAEPEPEIDLAETHKQLMDIEKRIDEATKEHNKYLKELGLPLLK